MNDNLISNKINTFTAQTLINKSYNIIQPQKKMQQKQMKASSNPPKDQIITTMLTMRKLQKQNIIPSQITPINLTTHEIQYSKPNHNSKYLLISNRNIIYYGQLNVQGFPDSNKAIFIYSDGSYFEGQVKSGKPDGEGKITNLQGSFMYSGHWKRGLPDGIGKEIIGDNTYEGQFLQGKKNGKGKLKYGDGTFYEGNFESNVIQGEGKYFNKNNYWQGNWKNGYLQGIGRQIIAKNQIKSHDDIQKTLNKKQTSVYNGQFVLGQKSGFGNFKWNKNYEYEGKFEKGQLHGEGTFKFKGKVYAGVWSNGTQVKISELRRGVPSIILKGNIRKDGNIIMTNEGIKQNEGILDFGQIQSEIQKGSSIAQLSGMQKKWKSDEKKQQ